MRSKDKITISLVLTIAVVVSSFSGCITFFGEEGIVTGTAAIEDFFGISGTFMSLPDGITVDDSDPFYALIATPLAVNYQNDEQQVIPLYVKNMSSPSDSIVRAENMIGIHPDLNIDDTQSSKEWSLELAGEFWKKSKAVLLVENNQTGYNLAVNAVPLASYLSIPVIVTDTIDKEVIKTLEKLGVKFSMVCGDLKGYGKTLKFADADHIAESSIDLVEELFGEVNYITLTNPLDAYPPEVHNTKSWSFDGTATSVSFLPGGWFNSLLGFISPNIHNFTIPSDYKYAKVKITLRNLHSENAAELGDYLMITGGPRIEDLPSAQQSYELIQSSTKSGIPIRDSNGDIVEDRLHYETVLYDRGGVTFDLSVMGTWLAQKEGDYEVDVTVEKIEHPYVAFMESLSSISPYLTAYRKGIVFGKPDFAFAATDDVKVNGKTCPGYYVPRKNPDLTKPNNQHVFEIHESLNTLLANISDIPASDVDQLREHYKENPIYIALVGDATMIPQFIQKNPDTPLDHPMGIYYFGYGTPTDLIYGNIDPDKSDPKNDTESKWPYQENLVGRITGFDVQDASALVDRTIFYDRIINKLGDWKNKATVQTGSGTDFQKIPVLEQVKNIMAPLLGGNAGDPMKFPSGFTRYSGNAIQNLTETGGFNVERTEMTASQRKGFSDEALQTIKTAGLLKLLLFPKQQIKRWSGEEIVRGGELQENSNLIYANAHGSQGGYEYGDVFIWGLGNGYVVLPIFMQYLTRISMFMSPLGNLGEFTPRGVAHMDYGPSVKIIESCVCGKIDGMYPQNNIGQATLHAGVNTLVASSTFTNVAGYLEPRPFELGFGTLGLLNAMRKVRQGEYPEQHFGVIMHMDFIDSLIDDDADVGTAFRNARNGYLPQDANATFLWVPPLNYATTGLADYQNIGESMEKILEEQNTAFGASGELVMPKKYNTFHEYLLFGDPAFNPYQPSNNG